MFNVVTKSFKTTWVNTTGSYWFCGFNTVESNLLSHRERYGPVLDQIVQNPANEGHFARVNIKVANHINNEQGSSNFTELELSPMISVHATVPDMIKENVNVAIDLAKNYRFNDYANLKRTYFKNMSGDDIGEEGVVAGMKIVQDAVNAGGLQREIILDNLIKKLCMTFNGSSKLYAYEYWSCVHTSISQTGEIIMLACLEPNIALASGYTLYTVSYTVLHQPEQFQYVVRNLKQHFESGVGYMLPSKVMTSSVGLGLFATTAIVGGLLATQIGGVSTDVVVGTPAIMPATKAVYSLVGVYLPGSIIAVKKVTVVLSTGLLSLLFGKKS